MVEFIITWEEGIKDPSRRKTTQCCVLTYSVENLAWFWKSLGVTGNKLRMAPKNLVEVF